MRILVTGGAGFIGSHIVDAYLADGHEVLVVDDLSSGRISNLKTALANGAKFEQLSILDQKLSNIIKSFKPELINHHAAQKSVRESVIRPEMDCEINLMGLLNILNSAKLTDCRKIVFASSGGAIYGEQNSFPADENHSKLPLSPYGITKLCSEHYLRFFAQEYKFKVNCLRYSNVFGPRQDPEGEAGVVAIFCDRLLNSQDLTIYGTGEQTRDFVYVSDVVNANLKCMIFEKAYDEINIATGVETSVLELARALKEVAGIETNLKFEPGRPGEQARSLLDIEKARQVIRWEPRISLKEGLGLTYQWFMKKRNEVI